ncbi:MAG: S8 family serine peptidase [Planctomycetes bacterium]|nr:S8 family serine peptidase [Planctomycetota bacterium]
MKPTFFPWLSFWPRTLTIPGVAALCWTALIGSLWAAGPKPSPGLANPSPLAVVSGQVSGQKDPAWKVQAEHERQRLMSRLGVDSWQAAGFKGQGVKIAVLDTGFRGYRDHLGQALPAKVTVRSFRPDGDLEAHNSQHGILCAEVIHSLAPDASLLFANWDTHRPETFLAAARWARRQGARIISCSVVTPSWSDGEGGGEIHHQLAQILGPGSVSGDVLCFASAGNTTERHWGGLFHPAANGFHQWEPGQVDNLMTPWGAEEVSVHAYWRPGPDYDLSVYDEATGREVAHAHTDHHHGDRSTATVYFQPQENHLYGARVRLVHGQAGTFHLTTMESTLNITTAAGSVCFPADGPAVIAMGGEDGATGHRIWYSACGPNSSQEKPDLVGIIPFPSLWRSKPFTGTSATAPQGAALAALWWSRHPSWSADQVRAAMKASAQDLGARGPDLETGYGLIHLPQRG